MATTNPFQLLEGDNEDPTQLAAVATKKVGAVRAQQNAAVHPFEAVWEAKNKTSRGGGGRGGRRRGKSQKISEVSQDEDNLAREKGVGDDKKKDKEMTLDESSNRTRSLPQLLGMLFGFLCTLFRCLFKVARYFYASLESVFAAPASGALKASTTPQDPIHIQELLLDLTRVIPEPPPIVDSDSLRYDKLHEKINRIAESADLDIKVNEMCKEEADVMRKIKELIDLYEARSTEDDYQNWHDRAIKLMPKLDDFRVEAEEVARRVRKYYLFELYYCNKSVHIN